MENKELNKIWGDDDNGEYESLYQHHKSMENKETTDNIPTAEEFFLEKYGNKITASESWVIRFAEEYAKLNRDYHLTKQAEVIHNYCMLYGSGVDLFDKEAIFTASEEYKQTIK